jgi:hypothetical protein
MLTIETNTAQAIKMKAQLQALLKASRDRAIALNDSVTLEYAYHEVRFHALDCAFVLSHAHLERGVWEILPVNLHDFDETAIALVKDAIESTFNTDHGAQSVIKLNALK